MTSNDENKSALVAKFKSNSCSVSKHHVNVLDEDTFIKKLEDIIEKDFFPDLEKLKIQQAYNEAVKANNYEAMRELITKYNNIIERNAKEEEKLNKNIGFENLVKKPASKNVVEDPYCNEEPPESANDRISLDEFLYKNTSEDNISFETLIEESQKKEKAKVHQSWLFDKEKLHKLKYNESLMIDNQSSNNNDDITKSLDTWRYTSKNTLMYIPEGVALNDQELLEKCKSTQIINHSNTRFKHHPSSLNQQQQQQAKKQNTTGIIGASSMIISKIGIDGKETQSNDTPQIKGYKLVEPSPSPMPGSRLAGDESPMMFWGEIETTPFRLDAAVSTTPSKMLLIGAPEFKMPDIPEREKLALNLEEQNNLAKRKKKTEALKMVQRNLAASSPYRNSSSSSSLSLTDKYNNMSPAAQRLVQLNLKINTPSPTSSKIIKKTTTNPNTPSPFNIKPSPNNISLLSPSIKINSSNKNLLKRANSSSTDSLTDNLLKLPKT